MTDRDTFDIKTNSAEETYALGECMGRLLMPGLIIGIIGNLGTGKTALVKGMASGNHIPEDQQVSSPTFSLINEYAGRVPMYHLDAYRLGSPRELSALGFDELIVEEAVVIIEWADRVKAILPAEMIWIEIISTSEHSRSFHMHSQGKKSCGFISALNLS